MDRSDCSELANRFEKLAKEGLVDVKFYVRNLDEAATEQVCAEVTALYNAVENNEGEVLNFKDSRRSS